MKIDLDRDWLKTKYVDEQLSTHKIAKLVGCGSKTISRKLHEYGIYVRTKAESAKISRNGKTVLCSNGCGKELYRKQYTINKYNNYFCSWKCEKEYQSKVRRTSPLRIGWRRYKEYKIWRKSVLERDNNLCKLCGNNIKLVAHHVLEAQHYPELVYEISNGICLCNDCHKVLHKHYSIQLIKSLQEVIFVE